MDNRPVELAGLLQGRYPDLPQQAAERCLQFYLRVLEENERQNLTRLIAPADFLDGHIADTVELWRSGLVEMPAVDLGSGVGVPGLLYSTLFGGKWALAESETRKAEFLRTCVAGMGIENTTVEPVRGEVYLTNHRAGSVVARAVGPVERIYGWLRNCSTWNNLVLLKGPKWTEEWDEFSKGRFRRELSIEKKVSYQIRPDHGVRLLLRLVRR